MVLLSLVDITPSESRDSCECLILSSNSPNRSSQILLGFAFCNRYLLVQFLLYLLTFSAF